MSKIDDLLAEINKKNDVLQQKIDTLQHLEDTIFNETSKEHLDKMLALTKKYDETLDKVVDTLSHETGATQSILSNLTRANINEKLQELQKKIANTTDVAEKEELKKAYNLLYQASNNYYSNAISSQQELNKRQLEGTTILDDWAEGWEQRGRALSKGIKEISGGIKQIDASVGKVLEPWRKANHETMQYARSVGMSQKTADAYLAKTVSWASKNNIGILFNKSTDELIKLQGKYSEVLGRNVHLTSEQKKDLMAMEAFIGEEATMDIANNLENFGLGMSDSAEFIKETIDDATKYGIHAGKLTKLVKDNIKMAQNYTFKDGLRGLESMAKKAAALKADMSLVSGFADKVSTVEGAITTGAQLQVLGGSYALGSDPLSMLYESLNDMEGLFDRAVGMAKGKVYYNETTGNFEMGAMDRYLMKQAANSMGVDYTKMTDVAFRQASLGRIENQALMNSNISGDKDMLALVKNLATFDNGRAVIDINGQKVDVGSGLTMDHKAQLEAMQRTDSENLQSMAISLRSMNDIMSGTQKEINNEQANTTHNIASGINNILRNNTKMLDKIAKIGAWVNILDGGWKTLLGIWGTTNGILRSMNGVGNVFSGKPSSAHAGLAGAKKAGVSRLVAMGTGAKVGAKIGAIGATLRLGTALITGEDLGSAALKGGVSIVASAIGGALGGPLGAIIGGAVGEIANSAISESINERRNELRDAISDSFSATLPNIAALFSGPNSLIGEYNVRQLEKFKNALSDNTLESSELTWGMRRKLKKSGDLERIQNAGVTITGIQMAKGGYLEGPAHIDGGMPILGSNISVEGGEFVVNKEATKNHLPLLNKINSGNLKVTPREPLGKQMSVHGYDTPGRNMSHNNTTNISPISLNISGTIKLDLNGQNVDITKQLLSEPRFISELTNMIGKQMNIYDNGAFNKGNFMQKFV